MKLFRYQDGRLINSLLFCYLLAGLALVCMTLANGFSGWQHIVPSFAVSIYLTHLLVLCAYLVHELMHNSIFASARANKSLGIPLLWLLGSSYLSYELLKEKHFRHHVEKVDSLSFDLNRWIEKYPFIRNMVFLGQRLHLPAAELVSHWLSNFSPFFQPARHKHRVRVILTLLSRIAFYAVLYSISVSLFFVFIVALHATYLVLAFMDAYQHTYDVSYSLDASRKKNALTRDYEEKNTYTNLLSSRWPWLNLLVLNFSYHNVHHWKSGEPWYRLPKLHKQRYPEVCEQEVAFENQLSYFHKHRVERVKVDNPNGIPADQIGAAGVSFLVGI